MSEDYRGQISAALTAGDESALYTLVERMLHAVREPLELCMAGNVLRDRGRLELADRFYRGAIAIDDNSPFGYYELAVSLMRQGRHTESATVSAERARWPADGRYISLHCLALYLSGAGSAAEEVLESAPILLDMEDELALVKAFGDFLQFMPRAKAERMIARVLKKRPYLDKHAVNQKILEAKAQRRPFSLIRMGDGEGSFIRLNPLDEIRYAPLYRDNRNQFRDYWFGDKLGDARGGFDELLGAFPSVVMEADLVGAPLPGWVDHEYNIGSSRGISSLTNIYRFLERMDADGVGFELCAQSIHIEMGETSLFEDLLRGESRIGLISCFSSLPSALMRTYGVGQVEFYKLPGEQYFKSVIGEESADGRHYPDVFNQVMTGLDRDLGGQIFLIAGGILGKFYAQQIKRRGGMALDIGSLADVWANKPTRGGYEALAGLALTA